MSSDLVALAIGIVAGLAFFVVVGTMSGRRTANRHASARMDRIIARTDAAPVGTLNKWGDN